MASDQNQHDWKQYLPLLIILLVAVGIRFFTIGYGTNVDEGDYLIQGRELSHGYWPYRDVHLNKPPLVTFLGYPFFLISEIPIIPVRVFMILLSTSSILALWLLGRKLFDEVTGLVAAAWLALEPFSAIWAKYLHVSTLTPILTLWTLSLLVYGLKKNKVLSILLAGFFSSLCLLNKQTGIIVLPIAVLIFFLYQRKDRCWQKLAYFCGGLFPLPLLLVVMLSVMGIWSEFLYNVFYGNLAMAGFFHYTLLERWYEFRAVAFLNPLAWWMVVPGVAAAFFRQWRGAVVLLLWLVLEVWVNLFALSHVWQHYILAIMPPAYLFSGVFISFVLKYAGRVVPSVRLPNTIGLVIVLLCTIPFWPRANWSYPNITLEDERAFAAFIERNSSTDYLLCFVNSIFYIWTDSKIPPSVRGDGLERIPPFMNTAGRKYLTLEEMKKSVALWETLPMDFCLMYEKYYHQIFVEQDPHLEPVRIFLESKFEQTQFIKSKPTYYARMICFKRKS